MPMVMSHNRMKRLIKVLNILIYTISSETIYFEVTPALLLYQINCYFISLFSVPIGLIVHTNLQIIYCLRKNFTENTCL